VLKIVRATAWGRERNKRGDSGRLFREALFSDFSLQKTEDCG
jgi:hypothetical protein